MNYIIKKSTFKIKHNKNLNIVGTCLKLYCGNDKLRFYVSDYLGKGSTGQVYLIKLLNDFDKQYVIKISNTDCKEEILNEINLIHKYFEKEKIIHKSYPLYFGNFENLDSLGIVYPYLGFYNLENIKKTNISINFKNNQNIIIQIINQLKSFNNLVHCDLKPSNIVIDTIDNSYKVNIIDFGLIKLNDQNDDFISTNYITPPESLLSIDYFKKLVDLNDPVNFAKHDYIGLFCVVINLFIRKSYWSILSDYLTNYLKFNSEVIVKHGSIGLYCYIFYKFYHDCIDDIENNSLKNLIKDIEKTYPFLSSKKFLNIDDFITNYVLLNIDEKTIEFSYLTKFRNFIKKIAHFNYKLRPSYEELLKDPFLL